MTAFESTPVAVIGAGPVGLAAAAHLLKRGLEPLVLERGPGPGHAILQWAHTRMFSPWRYNIDGAAGELLDASGWRGPDPDHLPTGAELVQHYLLPLANVEALRSRIRYNARVVAIGRRDVDKLRTLDRNDAPFELIIRDSGGRERLLEAAAVIDASGTWFNPNPLASNGILAPGEKENAARIHYGIPDVAGTHRQRYANKRVLVAGSGHSAINALLDLVALRQEAPHTQLLWALRRENIQSAFGGGAADALPERGALGRRAQDAVANRDIEVLSPFRARQVAGRDGTLVVSGLLGNTAKSIDVDEIVVATGFRPDIGMLRELRLGLDGSLECPAQLAAMIDPNEHSCGTVRPHGENELAHPERDFYIVGMKSYGRAPTFLLPTGYEQVRSIAAGLAGDWQAAARVELALPETGVCNGSPGEASGCCAPTATSCCG